MKRLLLSAVLILAPASAWAACGAIPLTIKDAANVTQSLSSATAADGNCKTYIDVDTASQMHADMTAPVPLGNGTTGGWTPKLLAALSTTVTAIKSSAGGQIAEAYCWNPNATVGYLQLFDVATAGAVTLGTTVPVLSYGIPPTSAAGKTLSIVGTQFTTGIQAAATTTAKGLSALGAGMDCNFSFN